MEKYISLIAEASNKSAYRKRPIKTLDEVQRLTTKSKKKAENAKLREKETASTSTPRKYAISEAKKKAGRQAFKEMTKAPNVKLNKLLYTKRLLELRDAPASEISKINKEIDALIGKQQKEEDLMKDAEKYKDEPLKYLAKLQELKYEQEKELSENQIKAIESSKSLISGLYTPKALLETEPEFSKLSSKEKKAIEKKLVSATKGKPSERLELVKKIMSEAPSVKKEVMEKALEAVPASKPVGRPMKVNTIKENLISKTTFSNSKEKKFVRNALLGDDSQNVEDMQANIDRYLQQYRDSRMHKTDIIYKQAEQEQEQEFEKDSEIADAIQHSAEENAEEEMPSLAPIDNQEERNMAEILKEEMIDEGTPEPLAQADAEEVVGATKYELNENFRKAVMTKLPESEDEDELESKSKNLAQTAIQENPKLSEIKIPSGINVKKASVEQVQNIASSNGLEIPNEIKGKVKHREWLKGIINERKGKGFSPKTTGKGFKPISHFPHHLVAGTLAKHIDRVRNKRFKQNLATLAVHNNLDNEEYRQKLKQHLLSGGSFGDWFFKGLTAPFALASEIPIPGLQQIGQAGTKAFNAIGAPTLF